jgi:hypothetical protein
MEDEDEMRQEKNINIAGRVILSLFYVSGI